MLVYIFKRLRKFYYYISSIHHRASNGFDLKVVVKEYFNFVYRKSYRTLVKQQQFTWFQREGNCKFV